MTIFAVIPPLECWLATGPALPGRWLSRLSVQRLRLIAQGTQQIAAVTEQQADGKADLSDILNAGSAVEDFQQIAGSADALLGAGVEIGERGVGVQVEDGVVSVVAGEWNGIADV
ncbi:hypothetical protein A3218_00850 [Pseudomonas chlororaphis]|nr:hypothetical protein A3218_00850 [Pseudomonas chlororaphis]